MTCIWGRLRFLYLHNKLIFSHRLVYVEVSASRLDRIKGLHAIDAATFFDEIQVRFYSCGVIFHLAMTRADKSQ